jgi:hypothetical protein
MYKKKYLLKGGKNIDSRITHLNNYESEQVYKKLYTNMEGGAMGCDTGDLNLERKEPFMVDTLNIMYNNDGILEPIPTFEEFNETKMRSLNIYNSFCNIYYCLDTIVKEESNNDIITTIYTTQWITNISEQINNDNNADLYNSARVILYVKTYIHPRWVLKQNSDTTQTWSVFCSFDDEITYNEYLTEKQQYKANINKLLSKNNLFNTLLNTDTDTISINMHTSDIIQRVQINVKAKTYRVLPEITKTNKNGWKYNTVSEFYNVEKWDDTSEKRTGNTPDILIPDITSNNMKDYLGISYRFGNTLEKRCNQLHDCTFNRMNIRKRPICFFAPYDATVTRNKQYFINSRMNRLKENSYKDSRGKFLYDMWAEKNEYNTYDIMKLTSLSIVAEETQFINTAARDSGGYYDKGYAEKKLKCNLLFATGFRGELEGTPEYNLMLKKNGQFDKDNYKLRCKITFEMIKNYVQTKPLPKGYDKKHIFISGIGLGVWAKDNQIQGPAFLETMKDVFQNKSYMGSPDVSISCTYLFSKPRMKPAQDTLILENGNVIERDANMKNPGNYVEELEKENTYCYFVFAGDSNSYRGNEGMIGFNCQSGDPQYIINSLLHGHWEDNIEKTNSYLDGIFYAK